MKFICLTLMLISGITDSVSEQYEVVGPADAVFAVAGEDVILPCSVKPSISVEDMRVEWFRSDLKDSQLVHLYEDHEDRNTEQIVSYRGRTELTHQELQRGDASLKLSSVRVSDEGRYKCFIQSKSWNDDATVNVRVEVVGTPPVITVDGFDDSGGLHLQCESEGWYPEPVLEWLNREGVSLSSDTRVTHREADKFSVKHTITVRHRDDKIHCRVRLRHHMLETQIITTSKRFSSWRTSIILISVAVVLSVIAGILIAVFAQKNRGHKELLKEKRRIQNELDQLVNQKRILQNAHNQLHNEKSKLQNAHKQVQNEKRRIQEERDQLLQSQKMIIPKVITHLKTHMVNVILDADSAHPHLVVSDDGKQVRVGNTQLEGVNRKKERFDQYLGVLGKDGFSSGCFYYEVQVKEQTDWCLGVARESVYRKNWMSLSPNIGYWTVAQRNGVCWACDSPNISVTLSVKPQRVGVFVDNEEGLVSFYDVESIFHIYSFAGQSFNEKLYPFVCLGLHRNDNSTPLIICDDHL
ncbi:butyrophilin-like protein 3 isoform X1 [Puntigrus tetrazona]|uniref:butyrophilin-like protein 3 isoform X1 n=1 Tax=Puntigrus tetrazona TaxID=1606681 RepID=UPI001C89F85C|nr:butyrophilin-like protein 3 isoform X1 [Puntigrus tetrazona]XP_043091676.1 butyrophilin-like protein 3 isoform X1 [Puntigrus tetrazona]XP_043091677.1 butyrophilin-like protein 3 isoform X1 [Puntigrus tetrazona]